MKLSDFGVVVVGMVMGVLLAFAVFVVVGCEPSRPSKYGEALGVCVAVASTLPESQACRCEVNKKYGRECDPVADAGKDGAP